MITEEDWGGGRKEAMETREGVMSVEKRPALINIKAISIKPVRFYKDYKGEDNNADFVHHFTK